MLLCEQMHYKVAYRCAATEEQICISLELKIKKWKKM